MGACQSNRGVIPADSRHVMLEITNDKELLRRYSQEEGAGTVLPHRNSSLGTQMLDDLEDEDKDRTRTKSSAETLTKERRRECRLDRLPSLTLMPTKTF
mmetsp:Transcript_5195/g.14727  ORF Transcript_5195/g.14727 Transcript_5195/m.14727 type:complete len:99 (+) Transcript_5195:161-457(+)